MIATGLVSLTITTAQAGPVLGPRDEVATDPVNGKNVTAKANASEPLPAMPSPLIAEDKVLASAYYDTMSILSTVNRCSEFFGGAESAVDAFGELMGKVKKAQEAPWIGIKMSGEITNFYNARTKASYRLFDKVALNTNGPFYRNAGPRMLPAAVRLGSFEPNTREARVLIFLHELGHMMKGAQGKWLLPNDGTDEGLSLKNSATIENICGEEIHGLGASEAARKLAQGLKAEEAMTVPGSAHAPEF